MNQNAFNGTDAFFFFNSGDPTMFESYWRKLGNACTVMFTGYQSLSYFANPKNLCWFLEPKLEEEIKKLHDVVGNATVEGYHIVVGTGSSQLIQAALYALSDPLNEPKPVNVVSATPYYSVRVISSKTLKLLEIRYSSHKLTEIKLKLLLYD